MEEKEKLEKEAKELRNEFILMLEAMLGCFLIFIILTLIIKVF